MSGLRLRLLSVLSLATLVALAPSALGWSGGWTGSSASGVTPAGAVLPSTLTFNGTAPYRIQGNGNVDIHTTAAGGYVTLSNAGYTCFLQPTGIFYCNTPEISVGSAPAQSGALAISNGTFIKSRNATNVGDLSMMGVDGSNELIYGDFVNAANIFQTSSTFYWQVASSNIASLSGSAYSVAVPVGGISNANAFTWAGVAVPIATGNVTLTAAQYNSPHIKLTGSLTGNVAVIFPTTIGACWFVDPTALTLNAHAVVLQANSVNWATTLAVTNEYEVCYGDGAKLYGTTLTP